jgi:hypothetical protein
LDRRIIQLGVNAGAGAVGLRSDALYGRSRDGEANGEPPVLAAIREDHRLTAAQR